MVEVMKLLFCLMLSAAVWVQGALHFDLGGLDLPEDELGEEVKKALKLYQENEFAKAVELTRKAVDAGDARACFLMGWFYEKGHGVAASRNEALAMYGRAAEQGHEAAGHRECRLLLLGGEKDCARAREKLTALVGKGDGKAELMLAEGYAVGRFEGGADFAEAEKHFKGAAKAGEEQALMKLVQLYEGSYGFGKKVDLEKAKVTLRKAADEGIPLAMASHGVRLMKEKKVEDGVDWLKRAADQDLAVACFLLGDHYAGGKEFKKAASFLEKGVKLGDVRSMIGMGQLHVQGLGVEKSEKEAMRYFREAIGRGSPQAALNAAHLLLASEDEERAVQNLFQGYQNLSLAAQTIPQAQRELAVLYLSGRLGVSDAVSAAAWFHRAAKAGDVVSRNNLAALYEIGNGVPQNYQSAAKLYELAARAGHAGATTALGRLVAAGRGVKENKAMAWALFTQADKLGEPNAKRFLEELVKGMSEEELAKGKEELAKFGGEGEKGN